MDEIRAAREVIEVVTVQNRYSLSDSRPTTTCSPTARPRASASCPGRRWPPARLTEPGGALDRAAQELGATTGQVAIAWLLRRSPVMLPIPGTSTVAHLEENVAAGDLELPDAVVEELSAAT